MYEQVFNFSSRPFTTTPFVKHYFAGSSIQQAIGQSKLCVDRASGPVILIGDIGMGKSLFLAMLEEHYKAEFSVVNLGCSRLETRKDLLQSILFSLDRPIVGRTESELRFDLMSQVKPNASCPNGLLLLVDDAETLSADLIDELRLITNYVVEGQPRVRLVMAGRFALEENLTDPKVASFGQRIACRCYLQSLSRDETAAYIKQHIDQAGGQADQLFGPEAIEQLFEVSEGIPRLINQVADFALIIAGTNGASSVSASTVSEAWADVQNIPGVVHDSALDTSVPDSDWTVIEFGQLEDSEEGTIYEFGASPEPAETDLPTAANESSDGIPESTTSEPQPAASPLESTTAETSDASPSTSDEGISYIIADDDSSFNYDALQDYQPQSSTPLDPPIDTSLSDTPTSDWTTTAEDSERVFSPFENLEPDATGAHDAVPSNASKLPMSEATPSSEPGIDLASLQQQVSQAFAEDTTHPPLLEESANTAVDSVSLSESSNDDPDEILRDALQSASQQSEMAAQLASVFGTPPEEADETLSESTIAANDIETPSAPDSGDVTQTMTAQNALEPVESLADQLSEFLNQTSKEFSDETTSTDVEANRSPEPPIVGEANQLDSAKEGPIEANAPSTVESPATTFGIDRSTFEATLAAARSFDQSENGTSEETPSSSFVENETPELPGDGQEESFPTLTDQLAQEIPETLDAQLTESTFGQWSPEHAFETHSQPVTDDHESKTSLETFVAESNPREADAETLDDALIAEETLSEGASGEDFAGENIAEQPATLQQTPFESLEESPSIQATLDNEVRSAEVNLLAVESAVEQQNESVISSDTPAEPSSISNDAKPNTPSDDVDHASVSLSPETVEPTTGTTEPNPFAEKFEQEEQLRDRFAPVIAAQNYISSHLTSEDIVGVSPFAEESAATPDFASAGEPSSPECTLPEPQAEETVVAASQAFEPTPPISENLEGAPISGDSTNEHSMNEHSHEDSVSAEHTEDTFAQNPLPHELPNVASELANAVVSPTSQEPPTNALTDETEVPQTTAPRYAVIRPATTPDVSSGGAPTQETLQVVSVDEVEDNAGQTEEATVPTDGRDNEATSESSKFHQQITEVTNEDISRQAEEILKKLQQNQAQRQITPANEHDSVSHETPVNTNPETGPTDAEIDTSHAILAEIRSQRDQIQANLQSQDDPSQAQPQGHRDDKEMIIMNPPKPDDTPSDPSPRASIPLPETPVSTGKAVRMDYQQLFDQLRNVNQQNH